MHFLLKFAPRLTRERTDKPFVTFCIWPGYASIRIAGATSAMDCMVGVEALNQLRDELNKAHADGRLK